MERALEIGPMPLAHAVSAPIRSLAMKSQPS
jgi:hypothetical protein